MNLNVVERITLLSVLPAQGNFITLKIVRGLRESLSFSEDEIENLKIHNDGDRIMWNAEKDLGKEVTIGKKATEVIVCELEKLDKENRLTEQHISLCEKFLASELDGK